MPSAPYDLSISAARADALFASPLQRFDEPSAGQVRRAIAMAIAVHRLLWRRRPTEAGCHEPDKSACYENALLRAQPGEITRILRWTLTIPGVRMGTSPRRGGGMG